MPVLTAKWQGRCRRCGRVILPGAPMAWEPSSGATHVTEADCAEAPETAVRVVPPEDPGERQLVIALLLQRSWRAATSPQYATLPHEYTLRKHWTSSGEFERCVRHIHRHGYQQRFLGRVWTYYDIDHRQYWTCSEAVATCGLINRAVRRPTTGRLPWEPEP